jgi:putative aldouronate transport system substrate-binding protein
MTTEETTSYNTIYNDIDTYLDENIVKFIVGDKSLDEFDSFVNTLRDMGIDECIAMTQTAYDRYLAEQAA